jgi:shikimate kinase
MSSDRFRKLTLVFRMPALGVQGRSNLSQRLPSGSGLNESPAVSKRIILALLLRTNSFLIDCLKIL